MLITVSRQYAAGGSRIAGLVADRLDWQLVDDQFVDRVAERAGLSKEQVAAREERPPTLIEKLASVTAFELPELFMQGGVRAPLDEGSLQQVTRSLVRDLAEEGRCVLVGRACAAVLAEHENVLRLRVVAGEEFRRRLAIRTFGIDADEAERRRLETDANRRRYHLDYYGRDVDDPANYDLVLNSERLGWQGAAEVVLARCRTLGWCE